MIILFWVSMAIVFYTYIGYGILLYGLVKIKRFFQKPKETPYNGLLPKVSILIAAWNEEDMIYDKIVNTLALNYPDEKLQLICITDGSTDRTPEIVAKFTEVLHLHSEVRAGKMAAIERAIPFVEGEAIVFTDANTMVNAEALRMLVAHYSNPMVGAVAGEKRILSGKSADASTAGEGFYWKYESLLKKLDYALYSNVGAAGELFSVRTALYQPIEKDTIIDDHMIAMRIAEKGFIIAYEPKAFASETSSANSKEELKRKIRIAAGGIQSIMRLKQAANPFHIPLLTFQYLSHRVIRWAVAPFLMILLLLSNIIIVLQAGQDIYQVVLLFQIIFYSSAILGYLLERRHLRIKLMFVPYYFCLMNYAAIAGFFRYLAKNQSAAWERSERKQQPETV